MERCSHKLSDWEVFSFGTVIRLYVISYVSYLIFRRVEINQALRDTETMRVVDNGTELSRKAVLQMFRDPNILPSEIVIAVFAVLICLYLVSQVVAILSICGFLFKKNTKNKKQKTHRYKLGQNVVVSVRGLKSNHYCAGIIHARNENCTWHIVFSNRDVNELKADIKASSTVAELLELSKQISNVTKKEIEARCSKRRKVLAIKTLLRERLEQHEVAADHFHHSRSPGVYKKLQFKLPKFFKLMKLAKKFYKKYRYPLIPLYSQLTETCSQVMGFFWMLGRTAQLPSVLIWGTLIVLDNAITPWLIFHGEGKMLARILPMVCLFFSISYSLIPLVSYLTWHYGSGIFMQLPRPSDAQPEEVVQQFVGLANEGYMYGAEIYTHLAREVARESFVTNPIQLFSTCFPLLNILLTLYFSGKRFDAARLRTKMALKLHTVGRLTKVHPGSTGTSVNWARTSNAISINVRPHVPSKLNDTNRDSNNVIAPSRNQYSAARVVPTAWASNERSVNTVATKANPWARTSNVISINVRPHVPSKLNDTKRDSNNVVAPSRNQDAAARVVPTAWASKERSVNTVATKANPETGTATADAEVPPCLRTAAARRVIKVLKIGFPTMSTIASLMLFGLILHGVLRPVCVDKVWDGCLARTYPLLRPQSECPCVLFVAGSSPDKPGEGHKNCDSDLQCAEWEYCAKHVDGFGMREGDYGGQCIPNPCPAGSKFPFSCTDELHIAGKCSVRRPTPWTDEEMREVCDTNVELLCEEMLGHTLNKFLDKKFPPCDSHGECGKGSYCRNGGFCPQPNGNPWMNTQKLFGFDTDKCLKHCTGNASNTTCDRRSFQLPQFCPNATEDCIKEQELCGCWRLALKAEVQPTQSGAWGRGRCHACEMCTHLNDCPSECDVKPLRSLATASTTFSELWAALETHASETLIAFVITHASFEGESKLDLRKMVQLRTFVVAHVNEGTTPVEKNKNSIKNTLALRVSTPLNGCTTSDSEHICARKLSYFAMIGQHLSLQFEPGPACRETVARVRAQPSLRCVWLQDAKLINNQLPDNMVCGDDRKQVTHVRLENLKNMKRIFPLSRDWERLESLEIIRTNLESIPPEVGRLPNLIKLVVKGSTSSTLKTWLPSTLSSLTRLQKLHLELTEQGTKPHNALADATFSSMADLKELNLRLGLNTLPESICSLTHLQRASFMNNPIGALPACFTNLTNLVSLDVANTSLSELPFDMNKIVNLTELNVERNPLVSIPPSLSNLSLTTFGLKGVRGLFVPSDHPICAARALWGHNRDNCTIFGFKTILFKCEIPEYGCICGRAVPDVDHDHPMQKACEARDSLQ